MTIGTRSILFGVHQFAIHPWFVAWGWWQLYGFPWDPRLWVAFFVHDLGYLGKPNMDGPEGERHPRLGADFMYWLFDWGGSYRWYVFCLYHSRYMAKRAHYPFSRLCVADKLAIALCPAWLYLPLAKLSGELAEYMEGKNCRTPAGSRSPEEWYRNVQRYCKAWAFEHRDGKQDTWTGTKRDLAMDGDWDSQIGESTP